MKLLYGIGMGVLACSIGLGSGGVVYAQNSQQNSQTNGNGTPAPSSGSNVPYNPPTAPPGGYGDASTGSNTGKGSSGGMGSTPSGGSGNGQNGVPIGVSGLSRILKDTSLADETPENQQQMEMQQARARNAERQKQLLADTQKLVALANELQDEVNKSNKDMLSLDVVRKADEIDKLAKTVRDRMKNAN